jgi:hypothetical protein
MSTDKSNSNNDSSKNSSKSNNESLFNNNYNNNNNNNNVVDSSNIIVEFSFGKCKICKVSQLLFCFYLMHADSPHLIQRMSRIRHKKESKKQHGRK